MTSSGDNTQIRLNMKLHRQKLLKFLEGTNDTFIKPKIELVSKCVEKSHLEPKIEIIDPEPSKVDLKKHSDQLLEETQNYDSSDDIDEEIIEGLGDDDISVRSVDCNEDFTIHNNSDINENSDVDENDDDEQLVYDKIKKTYLDNSCRSLIPVLDVNGSSTRTKHFVVDKTKKTSAALAMRRLIKRESKKKSLKKLVKWYAVLKLLEVHLKHE
ncbi:uncharacterized protein LOC111032776 [Myzus persicae]|uniref:uncharacterized protein LOC111032776 n=1 Tax=Myzus persicae TaxID=13164 RepID=UPI000B939CB0|nr:uncharacterized protein LOC111032776 [Myzus persicae]